MKKFGIAIVIVLVVAAGVTVFALSGNKKSNDSTGASGSSTTSSDKNATDQTADKTATLVAKDGVATVKIDANDTEATPDTLNVTAGDKIVITFNVLSQGTYHGGLEFKSTDPPIESDPILPGKTGDVTFVATKSFKFTPYWYESSIKKDYEVSVNVL